MLNYAYKDSEPLTNLDLLEISYLSNYHQRLSSTANNVSPNLKFQNPLILPGFIEKAILRLHKQIPLGTTRRNFLKKIVNLSPRFLKNTVLSVILPTTYSSQPTSFSLDLGLGIKTSKTPIISIVIPVHNGTWITYRCLRALQRNQDTVPFEVIIVDDASTDQTKMLLDNLRGVRVIRNFENMGYLRSTNLGATLARGKFIALLNNDTEPISGWLDELYAVMEKEPRIAIAGSTLIYPDGRLQESGGQIFSNGNAWNLGRGSDPNKSEFRFSREVDYCSAAAILVRSDFWTKVNGFDERYIPAYCEDSDLSMSAWNNGYSVVVCPTSWVIHYEGLSHGNSPALGIKKHQIVNSEKLLAKWTSELSAHWHDIGVPRLEATRNSQGIIIICDRQAPSKVRDAGSVRTLQIINHLKSLNYHVIFTAMDNSTNEIELALLEKKGIEVHRSKESLVHSLENRRSRVKLFWLIREEVIDYFSSDLRQLSDRVPLVADLLDLDYKYSKNFIEIKKNQSRLIENADLTLLCSNVEIAFVRKLNPSSNVLELWAEYEIPDKSHDWSVSDGLLFVGGFRHQPNVEAMTYFVRDILPKIRRGAPNIEVNVIGTGLESEVVDLLKSNDVNYLGRVDDLGSIYLRSKVVIAPLLTGRGRKGKIGEALSWGTPVVTTSVGAEGFDFKNGVDAFIADDAGIFAEHVLSLIGNQELWESSSINAYKYADKNLSSSQFLMQIRKILETAMG